MRGLLFSDSLPEDSGFSHVYDATLTFCQRFLDPRDRTVDQMVQAVRSGKQHIVEAGMASGMPKSTEITPTRDCNSESPFPR
jgi:hypothetical protein